MACDVVVIRVESSLGFEYLCPHQLDVVKAFATGRDMLVPLPTGSRKSILMIQTLVNPTYEVLACKTSLALTLSIRLLQGQGTLLLRTRA